MKLKRKLVTEANKKFWGRSTESRTRSVRGPNGRRWESSLMERQSRGLRPRVSRSRRVMCRAGRGETKRNLL